MMQKNPCIYSSFIFVINIIIGIYYHEYIYASLFVALIITSILFHSYSKLEYKILDSIIVFTIFIYGGYRFYKKIIINKNNNSIISFIILLTFLTTVYLFFYGYYSNQYCYDINKQVANLYHSSLHIIGALGHILIMTL